MQNNFLPFHITGGMGNKRDIGFGISAIELVGIWQILT